MSIDQEFMNERAYAQGRMDAERDYLKGSSAVAKMRMSLLQSGLHAMTADAVGRAIAEYEKDQQAGVKKESADSEKHHE